MMLANGWEIFWSKMSLDMWMHILASEWKKSYVSHFNCCVKLDGSFGLYLMKFTKKSAYICCQGHQNIYRTLKNKQIKIVKP